MNATGVMPVIFASSLLAAPTALARYFNTPAVTEFAKAVSPAGSFYLPVRLCRSSRLPLLFSSHRTALPPTTSHAGISSWTTAILQVSCSGCAAWLIDIRTNPGVQN